MKRAILSMLLLFGVANASIRVDDVEFSTPDDILKYIEAERIEHPENANILDIGKGLFLLGLGRDAEGEKLFSQGYEGIKKEGTPAPILEAAAETRRYILKMKEILKPLIQSECGCESSSPSQS